MIITDKFTLFNIFLKKNIVYLILSINTIPINENEILITINNKILKFDSKLVKNQGEPILIFKYDYPDFEKNKEKNNKILAKILYKNITYNVSCEIIKPQKKKTLAITTLFKNDYNVFKIFYEYYKKQGVEHFYMYYNGVVNDEIAKLFNKEDVTLIEWNFRYWNPSNYKYQHHAQLGQMHDSLYRFGKDSFKYMIYCDLDEYLHIDNYTLKEFILKNNEIDVFGFCNIWSRCINDEIPIKFPTKFYIDQKKLNYKNRSKNIYKLDKINILTIHHLYTPPKDRRCPENIKQILDLNMYHFINWSKRNRYEKVEIIKTIKDL